MEPALSQWTDELRTNRRLSRPHPAGKIARLPAEIREMINLALTDNVSYDQIIARLEAAGHSGINPQNLSNWAHHGYEIWRRNRERLEIIRLQTEANKELLRELESADPSVAIRLNSAYISTQLAQIMYDFDYELLRGQILSNPDYYFRLTRTVYCQSLQAQRQQKIQLAIDKQRNTEAALQDRALDDLGVRRPTTSEAGYAEAAAYFGLPPRFSVPLPVPKTTESEASSAPTEPPANQGS